MKIIKIDTRKIIDWETFHDVFKEIFGFPDFYGRNMDAWIDCMASLDAPEDEMTKVNIDKNETLVLHLGYIDEFVKRCPEQYAAIVECSAFVNYRRIERGGNPVLTVSFYKSPN